MNVNDRNNLDFNRRDFLRTGSLASIMTMLGGIELVAQTNAPADAKPAGPKVNIAVIGLGPWGREILNTLARQPQANIAAVCDTYAASLKRAATIAPGAKATNDYKSILADKTIKAVVVATGTHEHSAIAVEALKAGKHVYCEAPLAATIEDAKAVAKEAKGNPGLAFMAGLQLRSDPQRHFIVPFIRSGALGKFVMARAQYHKKQSWRATSPNPDREKAINWRLFKQTSLGLIGEIGSHQLDQAVWFLNSKPTAVTGWGNTILWQDGREMPDTVQAVIEFPGGVQMMYDATLANSFDSDYELFYGSDAAVMLRESKAWMFKEVDSPLLGWEVYARKETFYKETGIALIAGASKSAPTDTPAEVPPFTGTPLAYALANFLRTANDLSAAKEDFVESFGEDDADGLREHLAKVPRQPGASYMDAYVAAVIAIKAKEAIETGKRVEIKPELYELT